MAYRGPACACSLAWWRGRVGNKLVVAAGLLAMAGFYLCVATSSATIACGTIAAQMVILDAGMGLTSAPATEAIIGSVSASLYTGRLARALTGDLACPCNA